MNFAPNGIQNDKMVKHIIREQPQVEKCNTIKSKNRDLTQNDGQVVNILGMPFQNITRLRFTNEDWHIKKTASDIVYVCRSSLHDRVLVFNTDFSMQDFKAVIAESNLNKSLRPDDIHGQMIGNFGFGRRSTSGYQINGNTCK